MVYRIHFTVEDLMRTRVAQPSPLMELAAAVRTLQSRSHPVRFGAWRHAAFAGLEPMARMVLDLIPPGGWAPTFLSSAGTGEPHELLDRARATPRSRIREDLAHMAEQQPLPPWTRHLADDRDLRRRLYESLDHVYDVLLSPHWAHVVGEATADRGIRMRHLLTGGVEALFASLDPRRIRWTAPVLEVAMVSGFDGDLHLEGQGLLLVPSVFGAGSPAIDIDAEPQPVVRYPVGPDSARPFRMPVRPAPSAAHTSLSSLMGKTRALVLYTIAQHPSCSTKELAALTGMTSPSASEHATTLRAAGLIDTVRHRNTALHSPTPMGIALLNSPAQRVSSPVPDDLMPLRRG
ncbi:ArsR/SmtB family transcription factor [Streptomyces sp. NRRL S-340]|uniref:ArsR/SmtB family transcription factor n=1 Tax=Streptomyces sp. NRRL S-340 TaxID=1463901 RepID=UPI0007C5251B|nr:winged helix-turn-helix domain-containing protein [Streptomyces sp. NRRL S-340]